jgi:aspartyl aminopeptidase
MFGFRVVDFGVPLLAMHSAAETGSIKDVQNLTKLAKEIVEHYYDYQ